MNDVPEPDLNSPEAPAPTGRPRLLTAIAIGNAIYGGLSAMALMGRMVFRSMARGELDLSQADAKMIEQVKPVVDAFAAIDAQNPDQLSAVMALNALTTGLAMVSAWGLLARRRFVGRTVGTAFALCAFLVNIASALVLTLPAGGGIDLPTVVIASYTLWVLFTINGRLRDALVH